MDASTATFDREYVLPEDAVIITHTDPQGRISYANAEFLQCAGGAAAVRARAA